VVNCTGTGTVGPETQIRDGWRLSSQWLPAAKKESRAGPNEFQFLIFRPSACVPSNLQPRFAPLMLIFRTNKLPPPPIPNGCYIARVLSAEERISERGNAMIVMNLQLSGRQTIPACLTFVEKARVAITAFCLSCDLVLPTEKDTQVTLRASDCLGRYLYVTIVNEDDGQGGDPVPKIVRFLTREAALIKNPELARVVLREQKPRKLEAIIVRLPP
jgi:hypothetical protein